MHRIPNVLSVLRLLVTPVILNRIWERDLDWALVLFFLTGMTDTIDGTLARNYGWTSKFGAFVDPIADKMLLMSVFLTLGMRDFVPVWVAAVVLGRDFLILLAAVVLKFTGRLGEFPPSIWGKLSTLIQLLTAGAVLLRWPAEREPFFYATAAMGILSFAHYCRQIWQKLN